VFTPKFGGWISWNFNKFLIGRDGAIAGRFGGRTKPDDKDLTAAVEKDLKVANRRGLRPRFVFLFFGRKSYCSCVAASRWCCRRGKARNR